MDNNFFKNTNEQNTCSANSKQYMYDLPPIEIAENVFDTPVTKSPYKPSLLQTVAATILCASLLIRFVSYYYFSNFIFMSDVFFIRLEYRETINIIIPQTLFIIGFILLAYKANNKASRTALGIIICLEIAPLFIDNWLRDAGAAPNQTVRFFIALLPIYCYWLIIENNRLSEKNRVWINFIGVICIIGLFECSVGWLITCAQWIGGTGFYTSYHYNIIFEYFILLIVDCFLRAISYWHLARCEAFSGKYDANAKCNYSPLNKWMAAAIIVPVTIAICLFLLYKNYELFI